MLKNKKTLIITDSLGVPRSYPEKLSDDDIWCYRLQERFGINVRLYTVPALASDRLVEDINLYLKAFQPEVVIIQIGIVDCSPRALTKTEMKIISNIPLVNTLAHKFIRKYRKKIVTKRNITYVSSEDFECNLLKIRELFINSRVFFLPIAPACEHYEEVNPGIESNICKYNAIINKLFNSIDVFKGCEKNDIFMSDLHHLNKLGHDVVYKNIMEKIDGVIL